MRPKRASEPLRVAVRLLAASVALTAGATGCPSGGPRITYVINGSDAGHDAAPAVDSRPPTSACQGDRASCLFGTVSAPAFGLPLQGGEASLYRVFPAGDEAPLLTVRVALDGTWAFSSIGPEPWSHYFVQITANFGGSTATGVSVPAVVGPFALPSAGPAVAVTVRPIQLQVFQTRAAGGSNTVQWASARVFEPATGQEVKGDGAGGGASVAIDVGDGAPPTPMPWGIDPDGGRSFFVSFLTPPPALGGYTITTKLASSAASSWHLSADSPPFDGAIASPAAGATVAVGTDVPVAWTPEPGGDLELVNLFGRNGSSAWMPVFTSPLPVAPDVSTETIPGANLGQPGDYLLNVTYAKVNCPVSADGCVYASTVSSLPLTVR